MRRVRFTMLVISLLVGITVVPALPVSASDDDRNRCTRAKVALNAIYPDDPSGWVRAIQVSGPERRCEPPSGFAGRAVGR